MTRRARRPRTRLRRPAPGPRAVVTLFPDAFPGVLGASLTGRALHEGLWRLETDRPAPLRRGPAPQRRRHARRRRRGHGAAPRRGRPRPGTPPPAAPTGDWPVIYLSPRGRPFDQAMAQRLAQADGLTLLCGRFEGVDQRVLDEHDVDEVSLGDFVLTGGEIAAQALIDATVRLIPRVLGNQASVEEEVLFARSAGAPALHEARRLGRPRDTGNSPLRPSREHRRTGGGPRPKG